jgi:predicted transcriptional regulator
MQYECKTIKTCKTYPLRKKREKLKISLNEFAKRVGLSSAFISDLELGRRSASQKTAEKIMQTLLAIAKEKQ